MLSVDLLDMKKVDGAGFIKGDFTAKDTRVQIQQFFKMKQIDTVSSLNIDCVRRSARSHGG